MTMPRVFLIRYNRGPRKTPITFGAFSTRAKAKEWRTTHQLDEGRFTLFPVTVDDVGVDYEREEDVE